MRWSIEGFDQETAVKLGLDLVDLAFLRWFVDFIHSTKMKKITRGDQVFYWVHHVSVIKEMPLLGLNSRRCVIRRLDKLVQLGTLHKIVKGKGTEE